MSRLENIDTKYLQVVTPPVDKKNELSKDSQTNPVELDSEILTSSLDGLAVNNSALIRQSDVKDKLQKIKKLEQEIKQKKQQLFSFRLVDDALNWNCNELFQNKLDYYQLQLAYFVLQKEMLSIQSGYDGLTADDEAYLDKIISSLEKEITRKLSYQNEIVSVEPYLIKTGIGESFFKILCDGVKQTNKTLSLNDEEWNVDQKILGHNEVIHNAIGRDSCSFSDYYFNHLNWMLYDYQLKRLPLTDRDYVIYRGFATDSKKLGNIIQSANEGDIIVPDLAYSYYSNDEKTSRLYNQQKGKYVKNHYYLKTYVPKGAKISINCNSQEVSPSEAVLPRNAKYRLLYKKDISNDVKKIYELGLEYIPEEIPDVIDSLCEMFEQEKVALSCKLNIFKFYLKLFAQNSNHWEDKDKLLDLIQKTSKQLTSDYELRLLLEYYNAINNSRTPSEAYEKVKNI